MMTPAQQPREGGAPTPCPGAGGTHTKAEVSGGGPYIAYDGTMGNRWTVVVRIWDAAATAWRGIATVGQIASSAMHAIALVKLNGPWPEGSEFRAFPPGTGPGALVWGTALHDGGEDTESTRRR